MRQILLFIINSFLIFSPDPNEKQPPQSNLNIEGEDDPIYRSGDVYTQAREIANADTQINVQEGLLPSFSEISIQGRQLIVHPLSRDNSPPQLPPPRIRLDPTEEKLRQWVREGNLQQMQNPSRANIITQHRLDTRRAEDTFRSLPSLPQQNLGLSSTVIHGAASYLPPLNPSIQRLGLDVQLNQDSDDEPVPELPPKLSHGHALFSHQHAQHLPPVRIQPQNKQLQNIGNQPFQRRTQIGRALPDPPLPPLRPEIQILPHGRSVLLSQQSSASQMSHLTSVNPLVEDETLPYPPLPPKMRPNPTESLSSQLPPLHPRSRNIIQSQYYHLRDPPNPPQLPNISGSPSFVSEQDSDRILPRPPQLMTPRTRDRDLNPSQTGQNLPEINSRLLPDNQNPPINK